MQKKKMIISFYLASLFFIFQISTLFASAAAQTFNATDDTVIDHGSSPNSPHGNGQYIVIRNANGGGGSNIFEDDVLVKFDLSTLPSSTTIQSATLNLYFFEWDDNNPSGRALNLFRITSDWNENTATWNNQPSTASQPTSHSTVPSSYGWMIWDVTTDVQNFINGQATNYGWKITDQNSWGQPSIPQILFSSKESGSNAPYLQIDTQSGVSPGNIDNKATSNEGQSWIKSLQDWSGFIVLVIIILVVIVLGIKFLRKPRSGKYRDTDEVKVKSSGSRSFSNGLSGMVRISRKISLKIRIYLLVGLIAYVFFFVMLLYSFPGFPLDYAAFLSLFPAVFIDFMIYYLPKVASGAAGQSAFGRYMSNRSEYWGKNVREGLKPRPPPKQDDYFIWDCPRCGYRNREGAYKIEARCRKCRRVYSMNGSRRTQEDTGRRRDDGKPPMSRGWWGNFDEHKWK